MLLEIIGERESKIKRERDRERVRVREREREIVQIEKEREFIEIISGYISIFVIINEFYMQRKYTQLN